MQRRLGIVMDLDGTVQLGGRRIPGAAEAVRHSLDRPPQEIQVVGDSLGTDVRFARHHGMACELGLTGVGCPDDATGALAPDPILAWPANLPALLGQRA
jgi:ribonucleotide monophosphatase NagD (HAD superfamily)